MKRKYRFNIHRDNPEMNKFQVLAEKEFRTIELPKRVTKKFTNDFSRNIKIVRDYLIVERHPDGIDPATLNDVFWFETERLFELLEGIKKESVK